MVNHVYLSIYVVVIVENIKVFAYHGCLMEETTIGSDYRVDLSVETCLNKSSTTDNLSDTVDYVLLNHIVDQRRCNRN